MNSKVKVVLLFVILASVITCMPACRKTSTIWGTWGESSLVRTYSTNGATTFADTTYYPSGGPVFTFTTVGTYFSTYSNGKYTLSNNTLTLLDTTRHPNVTTQFNVLTLNHNILILQHKDTISPGPLYTVQYTYTCVPE